MSPAQWAVSKKPLQENLLPPWISCVQCGEGEGVCEMMLYVTSISKTVLDTQRYKKKKSRLRFVTLKVFPLDFLFASLLVKFEQLRNAYMHTLWSMPRAFLEIVGLLQYIIEQLCYTSFLYQLEITSRRKLTLELHRKPTLKLTSPSPFTAVSVSVCQPKWRPGDWSRVNPVSHPVTAGADSSPDYTLNRFRIRCYRKWNNGNILTSYHIFSH